MTTRLRPILPVASLVALAFVAAGAAGCGEENELEVPEGVPVELGDLEYKVLYSRELNLDDTEDHAYLVGQAPPAPHELYFGVFLEIENTGDDEQTLPTEFTVVDTQHNIYESLPTRSLYALDLGSDLPPGREVPEFDSPAAEGPIKGAVVLFRITDSSTENRPLELEIPGQDETARVELDL